MKHVKKEPCGTCGHLTANKGRVCGPCLGGGISRLSWRAVMRQGSGGVKGLPRTVRVLMDGQRRCGGGIQRLGIYGHD